MRTQAINTKKVHEQLLANVANDSIVQNFCEIVKATYPDNEQYMQAMRSAMTWMQYVRVRVKNGDNAEQLAPMHNGPCGFGHYLHGNIPEQLQDALTTLTLQYQKIDDTKAAAIREFFFNAINPELHNIVNEAKQTLQSLSAPSAFILKNLPNTIFNELPNDINQPLATCLDFARFFALKQTCKAGYRFFHQYHNPCEQLLYVVTEEQLRSSENSQEQLVKTLHKPSINSHYAFHSLYHALEFIDTKRALNDGSITYPVLWIVKYRNDVPAIAFLKRMLKYSSSDSSSSLYFCNNYRVCPLDTVSLRHGSFIPIIGIKIQPTAAFSLYTIDATVNMSNYVAPAPVVVTVQDNEQPSLHSYGLDHQDMTQPPQSSCLIL
jgi:hypothetical protein